MKSLALPSMQLVDLRLTLHNPSCRIVPSLDIKHVDRGTSLKIPSAKHYSCFTRTSLRDTNCNDSKDNLFGKPPSRNDNVMR